MNELFTVFICVMNEWTNKVMGYAFSYIRTGTRIVPAIVPITQGEIHIFVDTLDRHVCWNHHRRQN